MSPISSKDEITPNSSRLSQQKISVKKSPLKPKTPLYDKKTPTRSSSPLEYHIKPTPIADKITFKKPVYKPKTPLKQNIPLKTNQNLSPKKEEWEV